MLEDLPALAASLGSAGFLGSFTAYLDYGLLVIEDANSRTRHDEWDDRSALVNVRADSLCIRTRVYVDGPVTAVVLKGDKRIAQGHLVFDGRVESASRLLKIEDSDESACLQVRVPSAVTTLSIFVDRPEDVGTVVIVL